MSKTNRRNFLGCGLAVAAATAAAAGPGRAQGKAAKRVIYPNGKKPEKTPLFSGTVAYGNLVFVAGVGYHEEGDIKAHTKARPRSDQAAIGERGLLDGESAQVHCIPERHEKLRRDE